MLAIFEAVGYNISVVLNADWTDLYKIVYYCFYYGN